MSAKILCTVCVPLPGIYVTKNHKKLLARLLQPLNVLLFLTLYRRRGLII